LTELVSRSDEDGVCVLTLNRPQALNALNMEMFVALRQHVDALTKHPETAHCVVLRGAGRSFCAGADLKELKQRSPEATVSPFEPDTINAFAALPQPTIGAIHGHCFTGGLELALAADILIAAENVRFADTHARWGLSPAWGMTHRLPHRVGTARAKEMMFSARDIEAPEALAMGLVNHVFPSGQFEVRTRELARRIAANAPGALRWTKRIINENVGRSPQDALATERSQHPGLGPEFHARIQRTGWSGAGPPSCFDKM
jgi:enoyl-CoA hydratase